MPKRKAASKLSGLVDDEADDDLMMNGVGEDTHDEDAAPPAKKAKGRPRTATSKATAAPAKPATRKARSTVVVGPKRRAAKGAGRKPRQSIEDTAEEQDTVDTSFSTREGGDNEEVQAAHEPEPESEDELESPKTTASALRSEEQPKTRGTRGRGGAKQVTIDGEFEYTPTGTRQTRPPSKAKVSTKSSTRRQKPSVEPEGEEEEEAEEDGAEIEETMMLPENDYQTTQASSRSPIKGANGYPASKPLSAANRRARSVSDTEKGDSEATLRRKLGDMTKKYENIDMKYRNLREVGILEANANVDKLRKQCEATAAASNELIASLKKELAAQASLAKQSRSLEKQLQDRNMEVSELEAKIKEMTSGLNSAQNEVKTLQTKLAASRNAATNVESVNSKAPGSAVKNGAASRTLMVGSTEAAHAAQIAQLKEDLYSDLTGLIIRDAKKRESDHLYDCIQTGVNGTLHFKLAVAHDVENTSFEAAEFHYMPLLDANRDRDLVDILPEYLSVDITFSRQHAAKFYSRVVDTLTKRHVD
ncbi:hypothetical protein FQN52_008404 [Onygenales sp. PD_12]|nr:hypothetical protein FQN52_008404 [Onygenales sp. PD_12]